MRTHQFTTSGVRLRADVHQHQNAVQVERFQPHRMEAIQSRHRDQRFDQLQDTRGLFFDALDVFKLAQRIADFFHQIQPRVDHRERRPELMRGVAHKIRQDAHPFALNRHL